MGTGSSFLSKKEAKSNGALRHLATGAETMPGNATIQETHSERGGFYVYIGTSSPVGSSASGGHFLIAR